MSFRSDVSLMTDFMVVQLTQELSLRDYTKSVPCEVLLWFLDMMFLLWLHGCSADPTTESEGLYLKCTLWGFIMSFRYDVSVMTSCYLADPTAEPKILYL